MTRGVKEKPREETEEESCSAFGYLRGVRECALALEVVSVRKE